MATTMIEEDVVIVGAGVAGLATAVALKRVGIRALVLEKSDRLRISGTALNLFPNAWRALDALGVSHKLTSTYAPTKRVLITNVQTGANQELLLPATAGVEAGPRPVHRKNLLEALADELPIDTIRFSSKIAAIETQRQENSSTATIHLEDGTVIKAKILIGCDGVHSVVAQWLGLAEPVNSGRTAVFGLAVFPEGHSFYREVSQFLDVGIRAGFMPLNDKEIYWFLLCNSPPKGENIAANPELIQKEVLENYAKDFPPVYLDVVRHSDLSTLKWAPLMFRPPWNIMFGNLRKDNITVAGDAMHPMTPDLGQGGCLALEDAVVLGRHIANSLIKNKRLVAGDNVVEALDGYIKERRWRVTWLVAGSYLSGRVQQGGSKWMEFLRDAIFYRFLLPRIINPTQYNCGKLPTVSFSVDELKKSK